MIIIKWIPIVFSFPFWKNLLKPTLQSGYTSNEIPSLTMSSLGHIHYLSLPISVHQAPTPYSEFLCCQSVSIPCYQPYNISFTSELQILDTGFVVVVVEGKIFLLKEKYVLREIIYQSKVRVVLLCSGIIVLSCLTWLDNCWYLSVLLLYLLHETLVLSNNKYLHEAVFHYHAFLKRVKVQGQ